MTLLPKALSSLFLELFETTSLPVTEIARIIESVFDLEAGLGLTAFQYLLLQKRITTIDLSSPLDLVSARPEAGKGGTPPWIETYA